MYNDMASVITVLFGFRRDQAESAVAPGATVMVPVHGAHGRGARLLVVMMVLVMVLVIVLDELEETRVRRLRCVCGYGGGGRSGR